MSRTTYRSARLAAAFATALAVAACAPESPQAPAAGADAQDTAREAIAATAADDAAPPVSDAEAALVAEAQAAVLAAATPRIDGAPVADGRNSFQFWFSARSDEGEDARVVQWAEDPCGMTPIAVVERMPLDDPFLLPDFVVEFDAEGRELRRWGKPYSAEIRTIAGDALVFRANHDGAGLRDFRTDPAGNIAVAPSEVPSTFGDATARDCPALPAFEGSDYVQCYEVRDADGGTRLLAWEGACS
ncbi:hypothetical protein [Arenimonas composti]|uniref:Lipoprotein n=1 Tax=Arenimonas composti TR7-09 = DSM 18010 TaxID=1121013 RepID=A0A091BJH1_9GAMM|nr:hypothetical protein [Arenimonas composti]KFN50924.1 hypothetical protein P873_04795 [Arenimonas composti TR7-09 = DSM 18010]